MASAIWANWREVQLAAEGVAVARQAGIWQPLAPVVDDLAAHAVARQPPDPELAPRSSQQRRAVIRHDLRRAQKSSTAAW